MANRWINRLTDRDVTDEAQYLNRRQIMGGAVAGIGLAGLGQGAVAQEGLTPNAYEDITEYNNYYEFGTDKGDQLISFGIADSNSSYSSLVQS